MKQFLIADQSGTPLYFDGDNEQLLCPLLMAFQLFVKNYFGESARAVSTLGGRSRVQIVLQVRGRLYFVGISNRGESAAELDTELQLTHDLLRSTVGPRPFDAKKGGVTLWQNKAHHQSFMHLIDTAVDLCSRRPNILVHSLERLETNASIRKICAQSLRSHYSSLPGFRAGIIFVGTRIFTHYIPGLEFGDFSQPADHGLAEAARASLTSSARSLLSLTIDDASNRFTAHDAFMLMLHIQSLFRPAAKKKKNAAMYRKLEEEDEDEKATDKKIVEEDEDEEEEEEEEEMLRRSERGEESLRGTPLKMRAAAASVVEDVEGVSTDPSGGILGAGWLPPELRATARISLFYPESGRAHAVYSAEILPGIFLAVVLRESRGRVIEQRKTLARAHVNIREWLERDYAAFLLTKEQAHMPVISYLPKVPGLVHFLFVDRKHNFAVAPGIAPLCGSGDELRTLTTRQLKKVVYNMVQYAHAHLAHGASTMVLRAGGFQYSYRLVVDTCDRPDVCSAAGSDQWPLVVSPKLYDNIISKYRASSCYELYAVYLEFIPVAIVTYKNVQLIKALSAALEWHISLN